MSFPAFIPEAVIVGIIAVEINMEPVLIRGIPLLLLDILKGPESASHMVEHSVQDDLHAMCMETLADFSKILVRSKPAVYLLKITCVIAVVIRLEYRVKQDRIYSEIAKILRPVQ